MNRAQTLLCCLVALGGLTSIGSGAVSGETGTRIDKSAFNFFNPTPPELLRDLSVDGPGATETPYTVDAGHFQIEMTFVDYTSEKDTFDGVTYRLDWLAVAPL